MFYYPDASLWEIAVHRSITHLKNLLRTILDSFCYRQERKITKELLLSKKGKCAIVLANGPSVALLDPKKVSELNYDIFAVNGYVNSEFSEVLKPTHYVLSDPGYFDFNNSNYQTTKKVFNLDATLFVPFHLGLKTQSRANVYKFCDREDRSSKNVSNILRPRGYLSMTAYKALSITLYMGYEKVYICGFDNDYILNVSNDEDNNLAYLNAHFYNLLGKEEDVSKLWPSIGYMMYTEHFLFTDLDKFNLDCDGKIINLSKKSLCNSFSKKHCLDIYAA